MKNNSRITRISDEIQREVANILRSELKDPRVNTITTVLKADTTSDLKQCKLFVSIMGDAQTKKEAMEGLKNSAGFIRKQLADRINLRNTPELVFVLDESLDYSLKIDKLLKEVNNQGKDECKGDN